MTSHDITLPSLRLDTVLSRPVSVPQLTLVRRDEPAGGQLLDVPSAVRDALAPGLRQVRAGQSVAVGVGSRGIARIAEVVSAVTRLLLELGAEPFIVPAMGSHGGATEHGQRAVLADLGITEESMGVPIRAAMDTVSIGEVDGMDVHVAREAALADHILVVNRLKSHTSFSGDIESGLAKMTAVGLGKQEGAEELHRLGPLRLEARIKAACAVIVDHLPVLGGLALVENHRKALVGIDFLRGSELGGHREAELLGTARRLEARLPFDEIDVLIVDTMGKEISGTGMDTNVIGRRMVRGSPEPCGLKVTNIVVLSVTEGSEGNAVGLGLADFVPVTLLENVDLHATYANALTAGLQGVQRAQIPIVLATDRDAVSAALLTAGLGDPAQARMARIRSTLALDEIMVTSNLLPVGSEYGEAGPVQTELFDESGSILPWPS
ncbi:MAG: hypothetical protein JWQ11_4933 [Rhizobacter sp.]|nr:hypothetical protein [Rhizobacter sp.]